MLAAARANGVSPSHLQAAVPFLLTALVVLVGATLSLLVINRAHDDYKAIVDEYERSLNDKDSLKEARIEVTALDRTVRIRPEYLADIGNWLIDGAGMFVSLMGPLIGLAILYERFTEAVFILYTIVILFVLAGFALFVCKVPPSGYPGQPLGEFRFRGRRIRIGRVWIFTPIVIFIAVMNLIAGGIVWAAGP